MKKKVLIWVAVAVTVLVVFAVSIIVLVALVLGSWLFHQETQRLAQASCVDRSTELVVDGAPASIPARWSADVERAASAAGIPVAVLAAQIDQESSWDPDAVNGIHVGLGQFSPATWAQYGEGDPRDPQAAIAAMGAYMGDLMDTAEPHAADGQEQLQFALASYNWGPGNMAENGWTLDGIPEETSHYIATIADTGQNWYTDDCARTLDLENIGDLGPGEWTSPLPGGTVTGAGHYGPRNIPGMPAWANNHTGLDLATGGAGRVVAPVDLRVTALYTPDGCVMAKATTGPDFGFAFCHLDRIDVADGAQLARGDVIGIEGGRADSLGFYTVKHLHFEMMHPDAGDPAFPGHGNDLIDPTPILREKGAL